MHGKALSGGIQHSSSPKATLPGFSPIKSIGPSVIVSSGPGDHREPPARSFDHIQLVE